MGKAARLNKELNRLDRLTKPLDKRLDWFEIHTRRILKDNILLKGEEWNLMMAKVGLLDILDIKQFFDTTQEFTSENLRQWMDIHILPHQRYIERVFGFSVNDKDSPIVIAQKILDEFGLKMACSRRGVNGERVTFYRVESFDPDNRGEVLERWLKHDLENSATA